MLSTAALWLPSSFSEATEWLLTRGHLLQMAVALLILLLLPSIFKVAWKQWRIFLAFQKVPSDPEGQHFIFGHVPK